MNSGNLAFVVPDCDQIQSLAFVWYLSLEML